MYRFAKELKKVVVSTKKFKTWTPPKNFVPVSELRDPPMGCIGANPVYVYFHEDLHKRTDAGLVKAVRSEHHVTIQSLLTEASTVTKPIKTLYVTGVSKSVIENCTQLAQALEALAKANVSAGTINSLVVDIIQRHQANPSSPKGY